MNVKLKQAVEAIKMPQERKLRIARNCQERKKGNFMRINKRFAAAAAVLVLCMAIPLGAGAAGKLGIMRDVTDWRGAITGQVYEQATGAISVSASVEAASLLVTARLEAPEERPFCFMDELKISEFKILDEEGTVVFSGEDTEYAPIRSGEAVMEIPMEEIGRGSYTLQITAFTADAKAEQPLDVFGTWVCDFTI